MPVPSCGLPLQAEQMVIAVKDVKTIYSELGGSLAQLAYTIQHHVRCSPKMNVGPVDSSNRLVSIHCAPASECVWPAELQARVGPHCSRIAPAYTLSELYAGVVVGRMCNGKGI